LNDGGQYGFKVSGASEAVYRSGICDAAGLTSEPTC
jgi:hypothetical protein